LSGPTASLSTVSPNKIINLRRIYDGKHGMSHRPRLIRATME